MVAGGKGSISNEQIPHHIRKHIQSNSIQCPVAKRSSRGKEREKDGETVVSGATENVPSKGKDKYNVDDRDNDECLKGSGGEDIAGRDRGKSHQFGRTGM